MRGVEAKISEADLDWVSEVTRAEPSLSRSAVARRFCERTGMIDEKGRPREVSARILLKRLESAGRIALPPPMRTIAARRPVEEREIEELDTYDGRARMSDLEDIEVVPVCGRRDSRRWWVLMERHYLGGGPLAGAQLRYFIRCSGGLLGGLAFSASARHLKKRDKHIGWSASARKANRKLVVCNSRFLLVHRIPNLASHVLAMALRRLADDWHERFGYKPVLVETFVDKNRFGGACYRAANWKYVGLTSGRGRNDRDHDAKLTMKRIFVCPLDPSWKEKLCVEPVRPISEDEQKADADWVDVELDGIDHGDARLNERARTIMRHFAAKPTASIPEAFRDKAKTKAAYRYFSHPKVSMDGVLGPHKESTLRRMAEEDVVLAVQDTTTLNYTHHPSTTGLGPIGSRGPKATLGFVVHATLASTTKGTPLGVFQAQVWARDPKEYGKSAKRAKLPIEEKESQKWLVAYKATAEAQRRLPGTRIVNVCDREADIFDVFEESRGEGKPDFLIRAMQPRRIEVSAEKPSNSWDYVRSLPCQGTYSLEVPRRGTRAKRTTTIEVRFGEVTILPPKDNSKGRHPITLYAVSAVEPDCPEGAEPVEWLLLTSLPVQGYEEALEKIRWYTNRWPIEVYFRTLKSGCRIEDRQLANADRLQACLAFDLIVAWRVFHLAKLGRETPDVPCTVYFEDADWKALVCFLNRTPIPPEEPPTLLAATLMVARLGGFLARKCDGFPGTQVLWRGLQRLDDIAATFTVIWDWMEQKPPSGPG